MSLPHIENHWDGGILWEPIMLMYKILGENREPFHGGDGVWPEVGTWTEPVKRPMLCWRGYHLLPLWSVPEWLGPELWVAEGKGVFDGPGPGDGKVAWETARLLRKVETWTAKNVYSAKITFFHIIGIGLYDDGPVIARLNTLLYKAIDYHDAGDKEALLHVSVGIGVLIRQLLNHNNNKTSTTSLASWLDLIDPLSVWNALPRIKGSHLLHRTILLETGVIDEWDRPLYTPY